MIRHTFVQIHGGFGTKLYIDDVVRAAVIALNHSVALRNHVYGACNYLCGVSKSSHAPHNPPRGWPTSLAAYGIYQNFSVRGSSTVGKPGS